MVLYEYCDLCTELPVVKPSHAGLVGSDRVVLKRDQIRYQLFDTRFLADHRDHVASSLRCFPAPMVEGHRCSPNSGNCPLPYTYHFVGRDNSSSSCSPLPAIIKAIREPTGENA